MKNLKSRLLIFLSVICLVFTACSGGTESGYNNTVTVLDVGQAACTLIEAEGQFALIDAGDTGGTVDIVPYLNSRGVEKIDLLVISHFHHDHTSGAMDVIRNFEIGTVVIPSLEGDMVPDSYLYKSLWVDASEGYYTLETAVAGKSFALGKGSVEILADTINHLSENDTSIALSYTDGSFVYLNTADMEKAAEKLVMENMPENVTLFAAGHHGSYTSSSYDFMMKISPDLVTVSCGKDNEYGHPHSQTIATFEKLGIPYHITREEGNMVYYIDSNKLVSEGKQ